MKDPADLVPSYQALRNFEGSKLSPSLTGRVLPWLSNMKVGVYVCVGGLVAGKAAWRVAGCRAFFEVVKTNKQTKTIKPNTNDSRTRPAFTIINRNRGLGPFLGQANLILLPFPFFNLFICR